MKIFNGAKNYTLEATEELKDLNAVAYTLKHDKTGARVVLISNDDDNKAFIIGFKTPQDNSTGVPHILEHSVLCGSKKYPVKDAMTQVSKGSLNTFLNAFTYPDRTLYPVASCNDKDFQNLMNVYLDAVFFPRVHSEKKIFMQEGWHYEMEDIDSPITYNGVVYNEMKGVYSSPEQALASYILFSLFPDTQYGVESGGDPEVIPTLTYEDFCAFHNKLYHPSNSRIFLYGDMDFEEKLEFIDKEYLSKFDAIIPDSEVKIQASFEKSVRIVKEYPISDSEDERDKTFLSYNVVCSDFTDPATTEVMNAINYALCSVPGAKLKERLIDAGIGKDVYSEMTTDTCQKIFSIIAQDANPEDEERFVETIESTIREIISEGFDKKALLASVTSSEFSYREADYGYYPKGIAYGTLTFEQWLYTDENIYANLKLNSMFSKLREGIENGMFERVLEEKVLNNPHKTILIMKPKKGLIAKKEDELRRKLAAYKDTLSYEEKLSIVNSTKELKLYQEEPDSEEALATIPSLTISDIKKEINKCEYSVEDIDGIKEVYAEVNTNKIAYFTLAFNAEKVPDRLIPALSVLKTLLGMVDTKSYSYGDLVNECNIKSGGISTYTSSYKNYSDPDSFTYNFEVRSKTMYEYIEDTFELIKEILFTSKLNDKKRVRENLEQLKVRIQGFMMQSGHLVSVGRASSAHSKAAALHERLSGIRQYRFIEEILEDFDNRFDDLVKDMQEVLSVLLTKDNLEVSLGCEAKGKEIFDKCLKDFVNLLKEKCEIEEKNEIEIIPGNEAFACSSQVQYVAVAGNYIRDKGLSYSGSIQVLKSILNTDYLWTAVRLQGGAYGCMCSFASNGDAMMVSYRDPNLSKTIDAYKNTVEFVRNYDEEEEDVNRYIISTIGDYDTPITPSMKSSRAYNYYKNGITNEIKQKERDEILSTTAESIRALADHVEAICSLGIYSCVGGEEILKNEGSMFDIISPLYQA